MYTAFSMVSKSMEQTVVVLNIVSYSLPINNTKNGIRRWRIRLRRKKQTVGKIVIVNSVRNKKNEKNEKPRGFYTGELFLSLTKKTKVKSSC